MVLEICEPIAETMTSTPLKLTDTTFRDAHQSLLATRLKTEDMLPLAEEMDSIGFHSMEVWGGATFDTATRFLADDPWETAQVVQEPHQKHPAHHAPPRTVARRL